MLVSMVIGLGLVACLCCARVARRQQLAAARRQRESERLAFLAQLVDAQRRPDELKRWISANSRPSDYDIHPT